MVKAAVYLVWNFIEELDVFEAVPVRKKNEVLDYGRDSLYFQVFPGHLHFMRGHSLDVLTEHDDSDADIMVQYVLLYS